MLFNSNNIVSAIPISSSPLTAMLCILSQCHEESSDLGAKLALAMQYVSHLPRVACDHGTVLLHKRCSGLKLTDTVPTLDNLSLSTYADVLEYSDNNEDVLSELLRRICFTTTSIQRRAGVFPVYESILNPAKDMYPSCLNTICRIVLRLLQAGQMHPDILQLAKKYEPQLFSKNSLVVSALYSALCTGNEAYDLKFRGVVPGASGTTSGSTADYIL